MVSRSHRGRRAAIASGAGAGERRVRSLAGRVGRVLVAHEHWSAAGLLALLVLAYLWPVLLGGKTLAPTALLYEEAPWGSVRPAGVHALVNPELGDVPRTYYPWAVVARHFIHSVTFPAWNPFAFGGTQLFANVQIAWLSPFSLPLWILPLNYALGLAAALKLWVAGFGTYLLVRELRLGFLPALLAAIAFALCAFNVVWLTYGIFLSVAALLPWAIWLTERIVRRGRATDALALTAIVALIQSGGHPGTQLHVLTAVALYALVRVVAARGASRERLRALGLVGAAAALGTLLLAVVLLPAQQAAVDSYGALLRQHGGAGIVGSHVPAGTLRTALFPEWWGRPSEHLQGGDSNFKERTFYAGVIPLVLATLALVTAGSWRRKAPFALLAALGLTVPVRVAGIYDAVVSLPLLGSVQAHRLLLLFVFAIPVLAAFGLRTLLDEPRARRTWLVIGSAALVGVLAVALAPTTDATAGSVASQLISRADGAVEHVSDATVTLASVAWWLLLVLALALALLAIARGGRWRLPAGALVVLLVAFDMLHFAHGFNPMGPPAVVIPPHTPAIAYLQAHDGDGRIAGLGYALEPDWSTMYGLRDVRGRDAPQPSKRFTHMWSALDAADTAEITRFSPKSVTVLSLLGARLLIAQPEVSLPRERGMIVAYSGEDAAIYRNPFAVPRAFVASSVHVADSDRDELGRVFAAGFDPRRRAVVRRDEVGAAAVPRDGAGTVEVVSESNAHVGLRAELRRPSLVVLDDQWAPGWSVRIDGRPARALQTDVVLRGVLVPAGRHDVDWSYRVPGLRLGAALSVTGLLIALAWAGALWRRRRGPRAAHSA